MQYKISDLKFGKKTIISVQPDSPLKEAITKMALNDYSQLPVITSSSKISSPSKLVGFISWKTIGMRENFGSENKGMVIDYMDKNVTVLKGSDNLLDSVNSILEKEFVFVQNNRDEITGIITAYDIAIQFKHLSEPFIELELIEKSIRKFIDKNFETSDWVSFLKKRYPERKNIESITDLDFGQYINIIENKELRSKVNSNIDKKVFTEKLDDVRKMRNKLMHFKVAEAEDINMDILKNLSKFFRVLEKLS